MEPGYIYIPPTLAANSHSPCVVTYASRAGTPPFVQQDRLTAIDEGSIQGRRKKEGVSANALHQSEGRCYLHWRCHASLFPQHDVGL